MSDVGDAFKAALGPPNPAAPNGLRFKESFFEDLWSDIYKEVGAGWYRDRFLYLFGRGLDALLPCLEAWSFLVPPNADRMIIGRNAHGALLVVDNANSANDSVHVLDPFRVVYWSNPNLAFVNLLGYWLAEDAIPHFQDAKVFKGWVKANKRAPAEGMILAPKVPLGLGGEFERSNFQEEEILSFYATSGPIYQKAFEKMGRASPVGST